MNQDHERLIESKNIIKALANGVNPLTGEKVSNDSFLNSPGIIRPLFFLSQYLEHLPNTPIKKKKPKAFTITSEEKSCIVLPSGKIGINVFAKAVNEVIDENKSKKVNGKVINRRLKTLGILSEETTENGNTRTITNDQSEGYGIELVTRQFNNREYKQVVFNDIGKQFLLDHLERIMS
ncbi:hypothetical protein E1I69_22330 [Bacillus timonensis]|uniref:Uncharacterized protein n=1 Tax=Bacillus timonensis TaxID=1033734 RepID=A0A4S3PLC7_9BACI|nr:hypothetical protein [Bacillus timonensis]THE09452.1 hypothetical protein E1I69_22330 [Bacillus timonensis]